MAPDLGVSKIGAVLDADTKGYHRHETKPVPALRKTNRLIVTHGEGRDQNKVSSFRTRNDGSNDF